MIDEVNAARYGNALKSPVCVQCGRRYHYIMQAEAVGIGTTIAGIGTGLGEKRAEHAAEKKLQERLRQGCDPLPCPNCGTYQPDMVVKLRRRTFSGWRVGAILLALGLIGAVVAAAGSRGMGIGVVVALVVAGTGAAIIGWTAVASRKFDPHAAPVETRIALGRQRSIDPARLEDAQRKADRESNALAAETQASVMRTDAVMSIIIGVAMLIGGGWLAAVGWKAVQSAKASVNWPSVPGKALITLRQQRGTAVYDLAYRYKVDGVEYRGDHYAFGVSGAKMGDGRDNGDPVAVFYDPADPVNSAVTQGVVGAETYMWPAIGLGLMIAGAVAEIVGWRRLRAAPAS